MLAQQMSRNGRHPGGGPFVESFIAPDMYMRPVGETVAYLGGGGLEVRDGRMGVDQILCVRPGAAHSLPLERPW